MVARFVLLAPAYPQDVRSSSRRPSKVGRAERLGATGRARDLPAPLRVERDATVARFGDDDVWRAAASAIMVR
jgi:hypothetical protein